MSYWVCDIVYAGIYDKGHNTFLPQIRLRPPGFAWRLISFYPQYVDKSRLRTRYIELLLCALPLKAPAERWGLFIRPVLVYDKKRGSKHDDKKRYKTIFSICT